MSDDTGHDVLEPNKRFRSCFDRLKAGSLVLKGDMSAMDGHSGSDGDPGATMNVRIDRFENPMARFERRLEFTDA